MSRKRRLPEVHRSQTGIPVGVRRAFWRFVGWYQRTHRPAHRFSILLANAHAVGATASKPRSGFGVFMWPLAYAKDRTIRQYIVIASDVHRLGGDKVLWETVAHEFAHYEQWCANDKPNEPAAEKRASELVKLFVASSEGSPR